MSTDPETYDLNQNISAIALQLIGAVNYGWSHIDLLADMTLVKTTKLDGAECAILTGKLETTAKLRKTASILHHRKEKGKADAVRRIASDLENIRPLRNAITHGLYQGNCSIGDFWAVPNEVLLDEERTARKLVIVTRDEVVEHSVIIEKTIAALRDVFGDELQKEAHESLGLLRSQSHHKPNQAAKEKKPRRPPQSSGA